MNTGHLIGYVGGLAVALGVGTAVWLGTPTASADASSPSAHSASAGTAKSARAAQRPNTAASVRPGPTRKAARPTAQAVRSAKAAQAAPPAATVTIAIDRSHNLILDTTTELSGGSTTRISVRDNGTGTQVGSTVTLSGVPQIPLFTADRDRVMVTTAVDFPVTPYSTQVAVIDTAAGTQVGKTVILDGRRNGQQVLGDDNRILLTTEVYALSGDSTHVSLIDGFNGTQIGTTLVVDGRSPQLPLLDASGNHAVVATSWEASNNTYASQVAVFDTHTGTQTGTTLNFAGSPTVQFVGDDGLALIGTSVSDSSTGVNTQFTVLDATSGAKVGTPFTLKGFGWNNPAVSANGTNFLVIATTQDYFTGSATLTAAVLDIANGAQLGHAVTVDGVLSGNPVMNDDGVHIVLTTTRVGATHVAVIDTSTGEQAGSTFDLDGMAESTIPAADGVHVLVTAYDAESTRIAVVDATTGEHTGSTLVLPGRIAPPVLSADGIHALVAANTTSAAQVAVINATTGEQTGTTIDLDGHVTGPLVNADGIHALFAASSGNSTHVVVVDSTTGAQTGTTVDVDGVLGYALSDAGRTHILVTTTDGTSTHLVSVNSATGQQTGVPLTFGGQLTGWPWPSTAADGTHALFILNDAGQTRLVLMDITAGTQTGAGLSVPGAQFGDPIATDGGNHTTIITRTPATQGHGSSTHLAVIDTTTGMQVGATTRITGGPAKLGDLSIDGTHIVVTTTAGLRATLDATTGKSVVSTVRAPWGVDVEALAITPLGRLVLGLQAALFTAGAGFVSLILWGYLILGSIIAQLQSPQAAAVSTAPFSYHKVVS
ncbi:beta strand repeat-containing protein [Mycolicibacterium sphagni]|uniref:PQQ-like beta-propeller repeat protein n=1 Tax=Mycolicibacterium sphagni TaxID=1786 RepID=A0ABX2JN82_9MYCO|nr:PQQ-like beta-propeller repeat protein [Mycolicibacterium sphagni]NTY59021.1 PQQ-like beta-propeller repeat protein [Mycolicibacterium sphagni]